MTDACVRQYMSEHNCNNPTQAYRALEIQELKNRIILGAKKSELTDEAIEILLKIVELIE